MKKQRLKTIMAVLIGCMGLAACGGHEENPLHHVGEYNPTPTMFEEYNDDVWEEITPTEVPEVTKEVEPIKVTQGVGNTAAALLKGGYFVLQDDVLYMAEGQGLYSRDSEGNTEQVLYCSEGNIGYLNICGDYIYYMTGVDRSNLGSGKDDKNVYRKCLITSDEPELVVSGVTDYGMGYGIRDGVLYCTIKERTSPTKYQYCLCQMDLKDLQVISSEANARFVAVADKAFYLVRANGEFVCENWAGEYSLGNLGTDNYAFWVLPKHNNTWSFTIENGNFYYMDVVTKGVPCIMKVSPAGGEEFKELGSFGVDYGTDLYALNGDILLSVGLLDSSENYVGSEYVKASSNGKIYDYSDIEGSKILYAFYNNKIVIYRGYKGIYWLNKSGSPEYSPCGITSSWGTLFESKNTGIEALNPPRGMGFCVE